MTTTTTANHDIDYITRDFNSSVDALITFATVNYGSGTDANRIWTDFNASSFSRTWLELVSFVADILFFYFDNQATQTYLQTASVQSAINNIAAQFGFVPATASSASGTASFTFTGAGTLLRGFRVQSSSGVPFYLTTNVVASAPGTYSGSVLQGTIITDQFTSQGIQNEEFNLSGVNVVRDLTNNNSLDISPEVTVNGNTYTLVNTFISSSGADSAAVTDTTGQVIGGGGRVFELEQRPTGTSYIRFGDGVFGRKLSPGETISIIYRSGGGTVGNIGAKTLTSLVDTSSVVSGVTNAAKFSGGADAQSIDQLRQLIPASLRTLDRAVAEQDYSDLLLLNFPQVTAASTETNTSDPGVDLNIYVVPTGTTITNITANPALQTDLTNFLNIRKMVTVQFKIENAYGIPTLITLEVHLSNTASKTTVTQSITTALQNFFNLTTGGSSGAGLGFAGEVLIEDVSTLIKAIPGIDRFEFRKFTYRPRVDNQVIGLTTTYTASNVDIFTNVSESEWLLAAAGPVKETTGTLLFHNNNASPFTYNATTGLITYTANLLPETLIGVAPGDLLRSGPGSGSIDAIILAVNSKTNTLYITPGLTFDTTPAINGGGSIRNGASTYESYKVYKKINAVVTNLSVNSITDTGMDLSTLVSTGVLLTANIMLDNTQTFIHNQYSTGAYYLVDAASNIWEIIANDSDTITVGVTAVNDGSVNTLTAGTYRIVTKLTSYLVLFNGNIFNINYNSHNTLFSIGAQFSNIGTIGNSFQISKTQTNVGSLGVAVDPISYDNTTKIVQLNNQPDLSSITSNSFLVDSSGQTFRITGIDNRLEPSIAYDSTHQNASVILTAGSTNSNLAQGFKVSQTSTYPVVSWYLKREGNISGNLVAKIVHDNGSGLPNLSSVVATANLFSTSALSESFTKCVFNFVTPPTLTAAIQYHLVISGDFGYTSTQKNNVVIFDNSVAAAAYTYISGVVQYSPAVGLSSVVPGNFIKDKAGNTFKILAVSVANSTVTIATGASFVQDSPFSSTAGSGTIYAKDNVYIGLDTATHTYADGVFETYNGIVWANYSPTADAIFSVEGPKSIIVNSNLTPVLGAGATISSRYYDDDNEISLVLGITAGLDTYATDVNALGKGTVSGNANSKVDAFVFRTSPFIDDIINLRANEIPQLSASDLNLKVFGGTQ